MLWLPARCGKSLASSVPRWPQSLRVRVTLYALPRIVAVEIWESYNFTEDAHRCTAARHLGSGSEGYETDLTLESHNARNRRTHEQTTCSRPNRMSSTANSFALRKSANARAPPRVLAKLLHPHFEKEDNFECGRRKNHTRSCQRVIRIGIPRRACSASRTMLQSIRPTCSPAAAITCSSSPGSGIGENWPVSSRSSSCSRLGWISR